MVICDKDHLKNLRIDHRKEMGTENQEQVNLWFQKNRHISRQTVMLYNFCP